MKQLFSFLFIVGLALTSSAQNNSAVVFSENGETFTLMLNGVKQNAEPAANVELNDLSLIGYQARIDFEDSTLPDFSNNNFALHPGFKVTYMVKINRKGKYVLRFHSETPYTEPQVSETVVYVPAQPAETVQSVDPEVRSSTGVVVKTAEETTVTQTISTSSTPPSNDKIAIEMTMPGVDVDFKMDVDTGMEVEMGMDTDVAMDVDMGMGTDMGMGVDMQISEESTITKETTIIETGVRAQDPQKLSKPAPTTAAYTDDHGCAMPEDGYSFAQMKKSIDSKDFEDSKLTIAKQIVKNKCLKSEQVKEIMNLFSFEDSKLEFAKFAYDHTYDQSNYYLVYDAFEFEFTIDELNEFLERK